MSFRFHKPVKESLCALAAATGRSQTFLAEEAIRQYCDLNYWQIEAVQAGQRAADRGDLAPHETIRRKWEQRFANLLDRPG